MVAGEKRKIVQTMMILLVGLVCCVAFADTVQMRLTSAVERCLTILIPSLYAMMILAQCLTATGVWKIVARPLRTLCQKLLHLPNGCFALFLLSQIAGYPVGAGMLRNLYENDTLSKRDAERLLCVCYGSGPAFLLGLIRQQPYRYRLFGVMLFSQIFANFLLLVLQLHRCPIQLRKDADIKLQALSATMLVEATANAGKSLLLLCGIVLIFSGACGVCDAFGIFQLLEQITISCGITVPIKVLWESVFEVTYAVQLALPFAIEIPMLTGLLAFGGLCVMMQVRVAAGEIFSVKRFFACRIFAAILSAGICRLAMLPFYWAEDTTTYQSTIQPMIPVVNQSGIFPACMLIMMTVLLLLEVWEK